MLKIVKSGLLLIIVTIFVQCQFEEDTEPVEYATYETKFNVENNSASFSIEDTLWITSEVIGFLTDSATKENIFFSDAFLIQTLIIRSWDSINQLNQRDNYSLFFKTYCSQLTQTSEASMIRLIYENNNKKYQIKKGIKFKKEGIYSIDTDKLVINSSGQSQLYGGGVVGFYDLNETYHEGYLSSTIVNQDNNYQLYTALTEVEKSTFQKVDDKNKQKYYFVNVLNSSELK